MKTAFAPKFLQLILLPLFVFMLNVGWGQLSITSTETAFPENFNGMSSSATAALPTGFKVNGNGAAPSWTTGTTATTAAAGTSGTGALTGTTGGGTFNFANGITASATDRALGFLTSGSFASPNSIILRITNNTGVTVTNLNISFDYEKYRTGTRAWNLTFFHGNTVNPTTAEITGNQAYAADAANAVVNPPTTISKTIALTGLSIANGADYYLKWTSTGTGGSTNSQGIALDNFSINATAIASTPTITSSGTLSATNTTYGTASATPSSFNVSGANMTAGITVTPPVGFEVSTSSTFASSIGTNSSPITVGAAGTIASTAVYVRLASTTAVGTYSGNIVLSSTSATSVNVATVSSTVSAKDLTVQASNQTKIEGNSSPLTGTLNTHYTVSGLANSDAANQVTLSYSGTPSGNQTTATAGSYTITPSALTFSTGSANNYSITYNTGVLTINSAAAAIIDPVTLSSSLTSTYGTASTGVSFTANGSNLTAENITATAEIGYQVSTDNSSFGSSASVASGTTVYVRLASTLSAGNYDNQVAVVLSGGGASSNVNVTTSSSGNTVSKATPTINSSPTATAITYGQTLASSTLSEGSASVAGSFAFTSPSTAPNAGTANQSITFSPTDNVNYNTTTADVSVTVNKANQTITFTALANKTTADVPFALTATASSGLTVSYTSSNTAVATVSGSMVTIVGAGTTTITASQLGNENYSAAVSASQLQAVTYANVGLGNYLYTGTASASGPSSRLNASLLNLSGLNSNVSFSTQTLSGLTVQTGSTNDNLLAVAVASGNFGTTINTSNYVQFTVSPEVGYLLSVGSLTFNNGRTSAGSTLWALRSSLDNYSTDITTGSTTSTNNPPTVLTTATINGSSFSNLYEGITFRLYPYGGGSSGFWRIDNLTVNGFISLPQNSPTLSSDATANTVDNNIDITFTEDATWRNAITAVKIGATTLTPATDYEISSGNIQLLPSGGNALLTTAGTKAITIVASGYTNATVSQVINAGVPTSNSTSTIDAILAPGATRIITCTAKDQYNNLVSGYTFSYDATLVAANATTTESYAIDGSAITSSVNNVSITSITDANGVATFTVIMPSALDEADGLTIQVQLANGTTNVGTPFAYHELPSQTITFNALDAKTYGDAVFNLSATGGASGNAVIFTSSNTSVATCTGTNGSTVTIVGAGSVTIYANQAGNSSYNAAAQVSQVLVVNQKGLTISGVGAADKVYNGSSAAAITGTPSYVGLVNGETFSVSGTGVATFSDAEAGVAKTVTFTGYASPSANYSLTQPTATATISQATQTISFGSLPNRFVGGPAFTLTQNATSGLAITYTSSNTSVATIVGNTVTPVGAGTTTITATQAGNNNYTAAVSLTQDLIVIATPIAGWDFFGQSSPASYPATTYDTNLDSNTGLSEITRGPGANSNGAGNSFSTTGFQNNGISTANTDYFQITLKGKSGYVLSLSEINANFDGTSSFYAAPGVTSQYAYSLDGTNFTLIGSPVTSTSLKPEAVSLSGIAELQAVTSSTTVTIRYFASGQTTTGGWRLSSPSAGVLGLAIGGSLCHLPEQLSLSSTSFCNNGETSTISSIASSIGVTYELYDSNGVIPNTSKAGTGSALNWTGLNSGMYYVVGTRNVGGCTTTSTTITLTATTPSYSYYPDTDGDGFGAGTAVLSCSATTPAGYSTLNTDCNNNNATISPGTAEICGDGIDNNCDNNETYPNQYRSAVEPGDWSVASTWEKSCSEGIWEAALIAPSNQYFNASTPFAVTIQSGHTVTVSTTSTTNFAKAGSLTVTGNLIINGNLTVTSTLINNGSIVVNHGASFVQSSENTSNEGSGTFEVNMNLTGTNNGTAPNGRYWYIGSPMNNTPASLFYDVPNKVRLWIYQPSNNSWVTLINSSTTASGATNSTLLIPGIGYLYRSGSPETVTFSGNAPQFNNNMTTPLALTGAGYKYVANPYTSHIDWRQVTRTGLNVSYWIRNASNTSYEAYNATSGVSTPSGTQTTQFIPPMQGFWVYAFTSSSSLRIDNGDRVHSSNVLHAPIHNQIVRLNLNDGKTNDQAVVYENDNASNGIEEYDTDKFMDETHHQLYFLEGTKQLSLDGLKDATAKQKVDMGIQITGAGTYTINAVELGVEEDVVLEDKFTHTFQDLKRKSTYSFTSNAGTYNNRFVLHFTLSPQTETAMETVEVGESVGEIEGVNIYTTTGQQVKVWVTNNTDFQNATVKVYDAVGNMIERKNMTSSELLLDLNTATGVYLVEVTGTEKVFTKKIFITK